jgi:hypothetical protein
MKAQISINPTLKDKTENKNQFRKKNNKNKLDQPKSACQTRDQDRKIKITSRKKIEK